MDYDFVPTIGGRGQRHLHGFVGNLFRIKSPDSVRVGHCFMKGRLKPNDLWLCTAHSGDCFQTYIYVEEYANCLIGKPLLSFGSYGIGDAELVEIPDGVFNALQSGGRVEWGLKKDYKELAQQTHNKPITPCSQCGSASDINLCAEHFAEFINTVAS